MIVYKITNKLTNKQYVGQTIGKLADRWKSHRTSRNCNYLSRAIHKYGIHNFETEVIEECFSTEELNVREIYWIEALGTRAPNGYNLRSGGGSMGKMHPISKQKIREAMLGEKNHFYGKTHTQETREKLSMLLSKENSPNWGRKQTAEHNLKISKALRGRKISESTRLKISKSVKCGQKLYTSLREAAEAEGVCIASVCISCKTGVSRKGKVFSYA